MSPAGPTAFILPTGDFILKSKHSTAPSSPPQATKPWSLLKFQTKISSLLDKNQHQQYIWKRERRKLNSKLRTRNHLRETTFSAGDCVLREVKNRPYKPVIVKIERSVKQSRNLFKRVWLIKTNLFQINSVKFRRRGSTEQITWPAIISHIPTHSADRPKLNQHNTLYNRKEKLNAFRRRNLGIRKL